METTPTTTPATYLITSAAACSVTLRHGERSVTWKPLAKAGQALVIVPAGCTLQTAAQTMVFALPPGFHAAL